MTFRFASPLAFPLLLAILAALAAEPAEAQMFGQRQLGGFLSRRNTPGAMHNPAQDLITAGGLMTGNERYLRGNRDARSFVGSRERGFVGLTQARERRTTPAAASVREVRPPNVNQTLASEAANAQQIYAPRLTLSPEFNGPAEPAVARALEEHLLRAPLGWTRPLEVEMSGRTAILRGAVATQRDRELAEALVRFEPGVGDVQNDLQIAPEHSPPAPPEPRLVPEPEAGPTLEQPLPREF